MTDQALSANTGSDLDNVVYGGITTLASGATKLCTELTELNPNEYDTCKITVTNGKESFINEIALQKVLYLRIKDLEKKWKRMTRSNWPIILNELIELFGERIEKYIEI